MQGTWRGRSSHVIDLPTKSHLSCKTGGKEEKLGEHAYVDLFDVCILLLSLNCLDRVLFRARKVAWKGDRCEILVFFELCRCVVPFEVVAGLSDHDFRLLGSFV